jgi:hypothetical protein
MPEKATIERARKAKRRGKSPSTQAGEFVREEIHHVREGKHGARSTKQAIAIGLSKARRAGVPLKPPKEGKTSAATRRKAKRDLAKAKKSPGSSKQRGATSKRRARATARALEREGRKAATRRQLSRQARSAAKRRTPAERSAAAKKAARTRKANRRE